MAGVADGLHGTGPVSRGPGEDGIIRTWMYDRENFKWMLVELNSTVEEELARQKAKEELQEIENARLRKFQKYQRRAQDGFSAMRKSQSAITLQRWKDYAIEEHAICKQNHEEMAARGARHHLPLIADVEERRLQLQRRREKDIETKKLLAIAEEKRQKREAKEERERSERMRLELWHRAEEGKKRQEAIAKENEERKKARDREKALARAQQEGESGAKIIGFAYDWLGPPRNCTYLWTQGVDGVPTSSSSPPPLRVRKRGSAATPMYQPPDGPSFYPPPEGDEFVKSQHDEPLWGDQFK